MAEISYLQKLKDAIQIGSIPVKTRMAVTWFRSIVERAKIGLAREVVPMALKIDAAQQGTLTGRLIPGKLYFFMYNPKHKSTYHTMICFLWSYLFKDLVMVFLELISIICIRKIEQY